MSIKGRIAIALLLTIAGAAGATAQDQATQYTSTDIGKPFGNLLVFGNTYVTKSATQTIGVRMGFLDSYYPSVFCFFSKSDPMIEAMAQWRTGRAVIVSGTIKKQSGPVFQQGTHSLMEIREIILSDCEIKIYGPDRFVPCVLGLPAHSRDGDQSFQTMVITNSR